MKNPGITGVSHKCNSLIYAFAQLDFLQQSCVQGCVQ